MFKNPDFKGLGVFIALALFFAYNTLFSFSKQLGISWVSVSFLRRGLRPVPSVSLGIHCALVTSALLMVFLTIAISRTRKRIKNGDTTVKEAIREYIQLAITFFLWLLLIAIILPPILRLMYYIF